MFCDFDTQVQCEEVYGWQPSEDDWAAVNEPARRAPTFGQVARAYFWLIFGVVAPWIMLGLAVWIVKVTTDPIGEAVRLGFGVVFAFVGCPLAVRNIWRDIKAGSWVY